MADKDRFRFNLSDDESEVAPQDEDLKRQLGKLSHRVSFLTLLLPCLLAVAVYVAYRDLATRASQTQSTELRSVERLSVDLDQRLSLLNTRISDLEAAATAKVDAAQSGILGLQETTKKNQSSLEKIDTAKADKKEFQDAMARLDSALAANSKDLQALAKDLQALAPFREELGSTAVLRKDVAALSSRLQKLEDMLGKDLTGLAGYMDRTKADLSQIKTDLSHLQARKLDRESMDLEILKAKKLYQMAIDQEIGRIDKILTTLQRRIDQVEKAFSGRSSSTPSLPPLAEGIKEQAVD